MENKKVGVILETKDYGMFKHLEGNRTDAPIRGEKIIASIKKVGYILSPIAVNEKYEVIDGQGRLYAVERLKLPVHYYVVPGADINECISMNIYGTKWKIHDYVESYATRGNKNYIYYQRIDDQFPNFGLQTKMYALKLNQLQSSAKDEMIGGKLIITEEEYKEAKKRLQYLNNLTEKTNGVAGSKAKFQIAIIFIYSYYSSEQVDKNRLINKIEMMNGEIPAVATTKGALRALSDIYNYRSRGEKMYFDVDYEKYVNNKYRNKGKE